MSEAKATAALNVRFKPSESSTHLRGDERSRFGAAAATESAGVGRLVHSAAAERKSRILREGCGMSHQQRSLWISKAIGLLLVLLVATSTEAGVFGLGDDSWQEEVLLHDGRKIVINRSQTYGGRHEIGQPSPIKEHTVTFTLPNTDKTIRWTSEYGEDLGRTNFHLLAVHVLNGTPYLVTEPNLCLSYNKGGGRIRRMCSSSTTVPPGNVFRLKSSPSSSKPSMWP
jgi:hypothetical protein